MKPWLYVAVADNKETNRMYLRFGVIFALSREEALGRTWEELREYTGKGDFNNHYIEVGEMSLEIAKRAWKCFSE